MNWKQKYKPAIRRRYLFLIAGILWSSVGVILSTVGIYWIFPVRHPVILLLMPLAFIVGVIKGRFILYKIAVKSSERIYSHPEKACFGSVFSWSTWLTVILMVSVGQILRRFIIPIYDRDFLGLVYAIIGLALFTASFVYWKNFFQYERSLQP